MRPTNTDESLGAVADILWLLKSYWVDVGYLTLPLFMRNFFTLQEELVVCPKYPKRRGYDMNAH